MNIHERILEVQGLLGRTLRSAQSDEERELFRVATAALMFISETGTVHSFEDYLQFRREAPPYAVASFETREEADAWLRQHPEPPHGAFVLIADEYHIVMHVREMDHRQLFPHPILEGYLEQIQQAAPPSTMPAFETREEVEAWLKGQPAPLQRVFMMIAGRRHVALHHRNLNHYSIHLLPEPGPGRPE
ncbi:head protein [Vitiosangium sp. GDMCC 1.1324]|uniref:head protein n=1 Tax=Vitiosangium sp. (strain GDMCC 1.1324) TaxID=2138576 RepID=UPI000D3D9CFC|nr:head protein [Vitiosangium sp. GDMCC 1.1324]PTL82794.1 head protein [Vitiosangium sp. GDMCC 1.1324]